MYLEEGACVVLLGRQEGAEGLERGARRIGGEERVQTPEPGQSALPPDMEGDGGRQLGELPRMKIEVDGPMAREVPADAEMGEGCAEVAHPPPGDREAHDGEDRDGDLDEAIQLEGSERLQKMDVVARDEGGMQGAVIAVVEVSQEGEEPGMIVAVGGAEALEGIEFGEEAGRALEALPDVHVGGGW